MNMKLKSAVSSPLTYKNYYHIYAYSISTYNRTCIYCYTYITSIITYQTILFFDFLYEININMYRQTLYLNYGNVIPVFEISFYPQWNQIC